MITVHFVISNLQKSIENCFWQWDFCTPESYSYGQRSKYPRFAGADPAQTCMNSNKK